MHNKKVKSKIFIRLPKLGQTRGQIADTLTWVIATTAIIVILTISIFVVQWGFKEKSFDVQGGTSDLLVTKSFMGYLSSTDGKGQQVWEQVENKELSINPDIFNGDKIFIKNIFIGLFNQKYNSNQMLLRIVSEECAWDVKKCALTTKIKMDLVNQGGLPPNQKLTKMFYDRIKLKDWGSQDKNTVLELFLN